MRKFERLIWAACANFLICVFCAASLQAQTPAREADLLDQAIGAVESELGLNDPAAEAAPDERALTEVLLVDYAIDPAALESIEGIEKLRAEALRAAEELFALQAVIAQERENLLHLERIFTRQLGNEDLSDVARTIIGAELVSHVFQRAVVVGRSEAAKSGEARARGLAEKLGLQREALAAVHVIDGDSQRRVEKAELAEKAALQTLEDARARETREQNQQIRAILVRERELAEQLVALTREEADQLRRVGDKRRERAEVFAERRAVLNDRIDALPDTPSDSIARERADPLFDELLSLRRTARVERRAARHAFDGARRQLASVEQALSLATAEQARAQSELSTLNETELARRQVALADLRVQLEERKLQIAGDFAAALEQHYSLDVERSTFFHTALERIVFQTSSERRSRFFSPLRDESWHDAVDSVRDAVERFLVAGRERVEQALSLPEKLFSIAFWGWVVGLAMRLLLFPLSFYLGREYGPQMVRRLTDYLLKKHTFRQRAGATIKFAEILRALLRPLLIYIAVIVVVDYVALMLPEVRVGRWVIDVMFFYFVTMTVLKVLVLPRGYRERSGLSPSPDLSSLSSDSRSLDEMVDVVKLEISRAQKLVLSVRFVLIFGMLARYVPTAVVGLMGHSVIWWTIDLVFMLGFLAVFYLVLSAWKDDIAHVFGKLARERMPRAVAVINTHKDRPYGVLLIAVASVYVAGREIARVARAWFVDTAWSRQASNFIFRKKIELQRREREEETSAVGHSPIPEDYCAYFVDHPLTDERFHVERAALNDAVEAAVTSWRASKRRGSVALTGEAGMGKTTLLNQTYTRWVDSSEHEVVYLQLCEKFKSAADVIKLLTSLFDLDKTPANKSELVAALRAQPARTVLVDDCHHLFMRQIGGFDAVDLFLDVVNLCDSRHFWVLSFNSFAWSYLNRVRSRQHYFGSVIPVVSWSEAEIQQLINARDALIDLPISFDDLVVTHETDNHQYEVVKTSNGYFRLLHEFCKGNPRVALTFWLRSLKHDRARNHLQVSLFHRPSQAVLVNVSRDYWFALAAIAQHGCLRADEIAEIIRLEPGFCEMILDYFIDNDIVSLDRRTQRVSLTPLYFRSVIKHLGDSNFLYE
ncbi:MAG: AAA family ATPase [Bradymonadaceae bacterium]|nr:AAA family ATPase [Lujinxingiaceae bacterium]